MELILVSRVKGARKPVQSQKAFLSSVVLPDTPHFTFRTFYWWTRTTNVYLDIKIRKI